MLEISGHFVALRLAVVEKEKITLNLLLKVGNRAIRNRLLQQT